MYTCIVGTSRCGTTLLRDMLHAHPDLVLFRETHWLPKLVEFFGSQRVPPELLLSVIEKTTWVGGETLLDVNLVYSRFATKSDLLSALHSEFGASGYLTIQEFSSILVRVLFDWDGFWGDKTPDYGFYMGMIQSLWPQCRFIHIIRDGVSTARSMSRHSGCQLMVSAGVDNWCSLSYDRLFEKYEARVLPLQDYVATWRRRLLRIQDEAKRLREGSYMEVRYEDLLAEPRNVIGQVCSFLDLSSSATWLESSIGLIKTAPREAGLEAGLYYRLSALDLLTLNRYHPGGDHPFLCLPPQADVSEVRRAGRAAGQALQAGSGRAALHLAMQMMGTAGCHNDSSLLAEAHAIAIRGSRQSGEAELAHHWVQSAHQYGFSFLGEEGSSS